MAVHQIRGFNDNVANQNAELVRVKLGDFSAEDFMNDAWNARTVKELRELRGTADASTGRPLASRPWRSLCS